MGGGGNSILKTLALTAVSFIVPGSAAFAPALFAKRFAFSYALGLLTKVNAPTFSTPSEAFLNQTSQDITSTNPIQSWKIPYGLTITGGTLTYAETAASDSNYLHMVVVFSPVEIEGYRSIIVNEDKVVDFETNAGNLETTRAESKQDYTNGFGNNTTLFDFSVTSSQSAHVAGCTMGGDFKIRNSSTVLKTESHTDNGSDANFSTGRIFHYFLSATSTMTSFNGRFESDGANAGSTNTGWKYYAFRNNFQLDAEYRDYMFPILYDGSHDNDDDTSQSFPAVGGSDLAGNSPYWSNWGIPASVDYLRDITARDSQNYPRDHANFWWGNNEHATAYPANVPIESEYTATKDDQKEPYHLYQDLAFMHCILKKDDVFQGRMPNISAIIKGKKVFDSRTNNTMWRSNPVWILRDYLTNADYGCGIDSIRIDQTSFDAVANLCDETVTYSAYPSVGATRPVFTGTDLGASDSDWGDWSYDSDIGKWIWRAQSPEFFLPFQIGDYVDIQKKGNSLNLGDHKTNVRVIRLLDGARGFESNLSSAGDSTALVGTAIKYERTRYECHGLVDTANSKKTNIDNILATMAAKLLVQNGQYFLIGGEYVGPSGTISSDDMIGEVSVQGKPPSRETFNIIKGVFSSRNENFQARDFEIFEDTNAISQDDNEKSTADLQLNLVTSGAQALALAKITLRRQRYYTKVSMTCNLKVFKYKVGDTVYIDHPQYNFGSRKFEIVDMKMNFGPDPTVEVLCQETDQSIYADN